jgi:hypothetical protein
VELAEAGGRAAPDAVQAARRRRGGGAGGVGRVGPGGWDGVGAARSLSLSLSLSLWHSGRPPPGTRRLSSHAAPPAYCARTRPHARSNTRLRTLARAGETERSAVAGLLGGIPGLAPAPALGAAHALAASDEAAHAPERAA